MTFNKLQALILEGAPDKRMLLETKDAMKHFSYTSYSFRITNAFRKSNIPDDEKEQMVLVRNIVFYDKDLPRYRRTGSFDNQTTYTR
tara:strand:+ start:1924 stop:2184 length:261 start_codon:yes stop_codon:yes gene_type:complete